MTGFGPRQGRLRTTPNGWGRPILYLSGREKCRGRGGRCHGSSMYAYDRAALRSLFGSDQTMHTLNIGLMIEHAQRVHVNFQNALFFLTFLFALFA